MGIGTKMPAVGIDRLVAIVSQDLVIGSRSVVWGNVAVVPIMFAQRYFAEIAVAIEKHMADIPALQVTMEQPDLIMPVLSTLGPVYIKDVLPILVLIGLWHLILTTGIDLVPFTIDKPLLPFPGAPLYDQQKIIPEMCVASQPITGGAHDSVVTAGRF